MIRVGYFVDTFNIGGAETVVIQLAEQLLLEKNYVPVVIHFGSNDIVTRCEQLHIPHIIAPGYRFYKKTLKLPLFALVFKRWLHQNKIDVLHSHLFGSIIASAPAAKLCGIPLIGTLHDIYTIEDRPARIWFLRLASLLGTKLITVSRQMEKFYKDQGGFKKNALKTIYNGVNPDKYNSLKSRHIRHEFNISDETIVITCVARLVQLKRHDLLIKSCGAFDKGLKFKLFIVGDGPERAFCEELASSLALSEHVIFLGERTDVADILKESDIFCLTSDTEGLSCSILEAMASGLPVLATDVGGNSELVADGINGYLVKKGSVQEITEKLQFMASNKKCRSEFGLQSREIIRDKYLWIETFNNYMKMYNLKT